MKHIIYKHRNKINGKEYIGKTSKGVLTRLNSHLEDMKNGSETHFHRALRKYGIDNFDSEILEYDITDELINEREIYWIDYYDTFNNGYNMTLGGDGGNTRVKMSNERYKQYCESISKSNKDRDFTYEHKKKISISKSEKPTKSFGMNNGRARNITIYDNNDNIVCECKGNYLKETKKLGICYVNIQISANNYGMPIFNKKDRSINGYYCVDSDLGINPEKWLYTYCIKDMNDNIIHRIIKGYKLSDYLKDNDLPSGLLKSKKDKRLYNKCRPNDIVKHEKSGNIKYMGWYIEKL